jgi:hypothetical protein
LAVSKFSGSNMRPEGSGTEDRQIELEVKLLKTGLSPRFGEQDLDHARALANCLDDCPPILVQRNTFVIIDGVHRLLAARMLNRRTILARYFDGSHEDAVLQAIKANVAHGKPLTLAEREWAAKSVLQTRSDLSNRLVGDVCGLSDKTVGRLRRSIAEVQQSATRVGRDGRRRPARPQQIRAAIAAALTEAPNMSASDIAYALSTSASTVRDVRQRLARGEPGVATHAGGAERMIGKTDPNATKPGIGKIWRLDSAIQSIPGGIKLGQWLDSTRISDDDWINYIDIMPLGRLPQLISEGRSRSIAWVRFAASLEERARRLTQGPKIHR